MATFALGCFYLLEGLLIAWLLKNNFNLFGFIYNPANKFFFLILDLIFIILCLLAISEQAHWFLMVLFLMHFFNSGALFLYSSSFYETKNEMRELGETTIANSIIGIVSVAGIFCIYITYL
ncbi:hypothetical protein OAC45_01645 [Gammaproteobacteria bacterium]|nr:hypothetical protein [Gammaproteobacteria bacterium]|tara:strand:- start:288 stop:650 length:363 start_codon:yes stop_codon:yes gene_type:complete